MSRDDAPARLSGTLAVAAGATGALALGASAGAAVGILGVLLVANGALRGSRRSITTGAFAVFAGVVVAGLRGAPAEAVLVGTIAAVLAWDLGEQAINVGEQLGRGASTRRGEAVHAAASTAVGASAAGAGYLVFLFASGGQPLAALVFLLAAALAFAAAVRD